MALTSALRALQAYDSNEEDDGAIDDEDIDFKNIKEIDVDKDVAIVVDMLLQHVCTSLSISHNNRLHSVLPDFRTTRNDHEIDIDDSSSLSSSSSSSWSLSSDEPDKFEADMGEDKVKKAPKTKGEMDLDELPKLQKLNLVAHVEELSHVGRVVNILDRLVTVVSFKHLPPLDLDTVLFSKDGKAIGPIFDVFGPVKEPRYVLRFNSREEIDEMEVTVDMAIYYAPNLPYTSYVFTAHLMTMRGSDASWKHDNEPPEDIKYYSDDEEERRDRSRVKRKSNNLNFNPSTYHCQE